jgi:hypothetical protein
MNGVFLAAVLAVIVRPPAPAAHVVAGTIVTLSGQTFVLSLRSRHRLRVNASPAVASGHYSAPLFAGKIVIVQGTYAADGSFVAHSVTRLTRLDATTALDR